MNCPRCNAPNENDARFCKNCALPFYPNQYSPVSNTIPFQQEIKKDKSLLYVSILLALICVETIFYLLVEKIIVPILYGKETYGTGANKIYNVLSWSFNLATITLSIIFLIKTKNTLVRILLITYAVLMLYNFYQYDIAPLLEKKDDFIYYNF
jgi:hypothetical protein